MATEAEKDQAVVGVSDGQRGLITLLQLLRCGLDHHAIRRRVKRGWLRPVHRGVYLVGHAELVRYQRETAAVLAYPSGTLIVARSSLAIWDIISEDPEREVDVGLVGRAYRS